MKNQIKMEKQAKQTKQTVGIYAIIMVNPQLTRYYNNHQFARFKRYVQRRNVCALPMYFNSVNEFVYFAAGFLTAVPEERRADVLMVSTNKPKGTRYLLEITRNWNPN